VQIAVSSELAPFQPQFSSASRSHRACNNALDARIYEKGIKVSDAEMKRLDIRDNTFHPEWNYTIIPRPTDGRGVYSNGRLPERIAHG
jgi:hypothetical protein